MSFRTQQLPILHAIAQYHVLQAYLTYSAMIFTNKEIDYRIRHAISVAFKAIAAQHFFKSNRAMTEGCGWHGFFEHSQLLQLEVRINHQVQPRPKLILEVRRSWGNNRGRRDKGACYP